MQIVLFDFAFLWVALLGLWRGKDISAIDRAVAKSELLVILSTSGGQEIQESTFHLCKWQKLPLR